MDSKSSALVAIIVISSKRAAPAHSTPAQKYPTTNIKRDHMIETMLFKL